MMVSVIVTTKNEEKNIANCLRAICNSINSTNSMNPINSNVEIIVVDNNSADNTVKITKECTDKIYNKRSERSNETNCSTGKAKNKLVPLSVMIASYYKKMNSSDD